MNQSHDKFGIEYLKLSNAKQGFVHLDCGFTCHSKGKTMLFARNGEFYFMCDDGEHFISGQADDGIHCVGIYPCHP